MVYLFYYRYAEGLKPEIFNRILSMFATDVKTEILKLKTSEDRNRKLIGRRLLMEAFKVLGIDCRLNQMLYSSRNRPSFNSSFDFNISHSGSMVVCGISKTHAVGIDVEMIKNVSLNDFKNYFTELDWQFIVSSDQPYKNFYDLWTKREAFLKATGTGLFVELKNCEANWTVKRWRNKKWINSEIMLDGSYSCHLCVDQFLPQIVIHEMYPQSISNILL
jgi:4'-phosphopantetheinyl transferase